MADPRCASAAERARLAGCTCCAQPCRCAWAFNEYAERSPARSVATGGLACPPRAAVTAADLAHGGTAEAWRMDPARAARYRNAGAVPMIPRSGSFAYDARGAFIPYGRPCRLGPLDRLCPPGMHSCKVGEPNMWTCVPNSIPCSVAINAHYHGYYVQDVYDTTRPNMWHKPRCRRNTRTAFPPPPPPCSVQNAAYAPCSEQNVAYAPCRQCGTLASRAAPPAECQVCGVSGPLAVQ